MSNGLTRIQTNAMRGLLRQEYRASSPEIKFLLSSERAYETVKKGDLKSDIETQNRVLRFGQKPVTKEQQKPVTEEQQKPVTEEQQKPVTEEQQNKGVRKREGRVIKALNLYKKLKSEKLVNVSSKIKESDEISLKIIAVDQERTVSWLVRKAVEEFVKRESRVK